MLQGFRQFIFRGNVLREPISLKHSTDGGLHDLQTLARSRGDPARGRGSEDQRRDAEPIATSRRDASDRHPRRTRGRQH